MLLNKQDSLLCLVDVQEKLLPGIVEKEAMIARCEWLLKLAGRLSVPVLASEQYPEKLGSIIEPLSSYYLNENCISKVHFSCMQAPEYQHKLKQFNKNQLILIGMETHVCVLQTALEMRGAGYDVYVVVDAVSSRSDLDSKYGFKRMKQDGVHLITAEMVFFEWMHTAGSVEFKTLSKEFF